MLKLNDKLKIKEITGILVKNGPKSIFEQNTETAGWPFFNLLYFIIFYLFLLENDKKRTFSRFLPKSQIPFTAVINHYFWRYLMYNPMYNN